MDFIFPFFGFGFVWFFFIVFGFGIVATIFWVWMLVDCIQHETDKENQKLIWVLVIIFTNWIGAGIYYFIRRSQRIKELGK